MHTYIALCVWINIRNGDAMKRNFPFAKIRGNLSLEADLQTGRARQIVAQFLDVVICHMNKNNTLIGGTADIPIVSHEKVTLC